MPVPLGWRKGRAGGAPRVGVPGEGQLLQKPHGGHTALLKALQGGGVPTRWPRERAGVCRPGWRGLPLPSARPGSSHFPRVTTFSLPEAPASGPFHRLLCPPGASPPTHALPSGLYSRVTFSARPSLVILYKTSAPCPTSHVLRYSPSHMSLLKDVLVYLLWQQLLKSPPAIPPFLFFHFIFIFYFIF